MSTGMITISSEDDLLEAIEKMKREDVRLLPVLNNKKLVGILTQKDIIKIQPEVIKIVLEKYCK